VRSLLYVFIGCLAFGVFYSIGSILLGGHGDHDGGVDHGANIGHDIGAGHDIDISHDIGAGHGLDIGHDIGAGHGMDIGHDIGDGHGLDIGHDIGAGHGMDIDHGAAGVDADHDGMQHISHEDDTDSPSPFNPLVIASAITAFGASGLISMTGFGLDSFVSTIVALLFSGLTGAALFFGVVKFMYGSQSNSVFSLEDLIGFEAEVITPLPEKGLGEIAYKANGMRSTMTARSMDGTEIKRGTQVIIREITGSVAVVQQKLTLDDIIFDNISENSREDREATGRDDTKDEAGKGDTGSAKIPEGAENSDGTGYQDGKEALAEEDSVKPCRNAGNKN
jgi:membrane protein implicated in regulation of membrane protease activity